MATELIVRPYQPEDRSAVRHVCHVTGYMGAPASWYWRDRESFADTFCGWYTDHRPDDAQVVEVDGVVSGYLLGCRDTEAAVDVATIVARHLVGGRHLLVRPGTARFMWRSIRDVVVDGVHRDLPPRTTFDARWPAHLHIDLLPVARGSGAGSTMMRTWLASLRADGIAGCHLETVAENASAIAFFEAMGFRRHGRNHPLPGMRSPEGARHHGQLMVQELAADGSP